MGGWILQDVAFRSPLLDFVSAPRMLCYPVSKVIDVVLTRVHMLKVLITHLANGDIPADKNKATGSRAKSFAQAPACTTIPGVMEVQVATTVRSQPCEASASAQSLRMASGLRCLPRTLPGVRRRCWRRRQTPGLRLHSPRYNPGVSSGKPPRKAERWG